MTRANQSATIEGWLAGLSPERQEAAELIRRLVRQAAPGVQEEIKWGRPVFSSGANLCYLASAKNHLTFGYFDGAALDDPDRLLEGSGKQMRSIKVRSPAEVPQRAVKAWTKQAASLAKSASRSDRTQSRT